MDDLVSKSKVIEHIARQYTAHGEAIPEWLHIGDLPSAQPERKKGKWLLCGNHHVCSECDEWALTRLDEDECDEVDILTDFCPNCGLPMEVAE